MFDYILTQSQLLKSHFQSQSTQLNPTHLVLRGDLNKEIFENSINQFCQLHFVSLKCVDVLEL